jgi:glutamyl-tRNA reductase
MVDLAVPRDIEAQVSELGDVYLYTVDDLEQVVTENLASRREAADDAEKIVDTHASKFMTWIDSLGAVPTIRSLRERVNQQAEDELIRARRRLQSGEPADEVLSQFARALTRKFTHVPSRKLAHVNDEELLEAARILFDLDGFDLDDVDRN